MRHRPFFTGDVFTGVPVQAPRAERKIKTVMVIQHPCAMRPDGVALSESILVAEVRRFPILPPDKWDTSGKLMPLPELLIDVASSRRHQAALFDNTFHVHPSDLANRIACLSARGVNILLQRWVYHSSRVIVPSFDFNTAVSPVYEQADIIEEWRGIAMAAGRTLSEASQDAYAWLREFEGSLTRERALQSPELRAPIRRRARTAASTWRSESSEKRPYTDPTADDSWFHRGPCHRCSACGENECWVYNPEPGDSAHEVHLCASGCDGPGPQGVMGG